MGRQMIVLIGSDNARVPVAREVATQASLLLQDFLDGCNLDDPVLEVPIVHFNGETLQRCVEHMNYRYNNKAKKLPRPLTTPLSQILDAEDRFFISSWHDIDSIQMVRAAIFLNDPELMELASAKMATLISERSRAEVRDLLGIDAGPISADELEMKDPILSN